MIEIGKLEGVQRHIETGVTMFFERKDPVVVYTVAWTAYNVLSDICHERGIEREIEDSSELKELGYDRVVLDAFRKPRNFFQHGQNRGTKAIKLSPEMAPIMLLLAGSLLQKIEGKTLWHYDVLRIWFYAKYMHKTPTAVGAMLAELPAKIDPNDFEMFLIMANRSFSTPSPA